MIPTKEAWDAYLAERHGEAFRKRAAETTVAICGLGGLGSNIAVSLARAGVGKLILIDFDRVDISNLHRQQYKANQIGMEKTQALSANLLEIAPYLTIEAHTVRMTPENTPALLQGAEIVCEAFDDPHCKAMLVDTVLAQLPEVYLVAASGMAGFDSANTIRTRRLTQRFYLCGDGVSDVQSGMKLASSRVMLCAAHEAHMVLRILSGQLEA